MAGLGRRTFAAGEVLTAANVMGYLQDQAVMNFAGTAARGSAIGSAVSEGMVSYLADTNSVEVYKTNGVSAWEPVNLSQSSNILVNGGFDIWQRGTSGFTSGYFADRWFLNGSNSGSRSTDVPTSDLAYSASATNSSASYAGITQRIEAADAQYLVGKYVTVSGWFKRTGGTNGGTLNINMDYANAKDNFSGTTYVGTVSWSASAPAASWVKYSGTFSVVAPAGVANGVQFSFTHNGSAGNSLGGLWAGLQVEVGLTANPFRRNGTNYQSELISCQRFFQIYGGTSGAEICQGTISTSTTAVMLLPLLTEMRAAPTFSATTASNFQQHVPGISLSNCSVVSSNYLTPKLVSINTTASSGFGAGQCGKLQAGNSSALISLSAEL